MDEPIRRRSVDEDEAIDAERKQRIADDVVMERSGGIAYTCVFLRAFLRQPPIRRAALASLPPAALAALVKYLDEEWNFLSSWMPSDSVYQNPTVILGFFVIFHTSHAYKRLTRGAEMLFTVMGDLIDTASQLFAFTQASSAGDEQILLFMEQCVRLTSVLFDVSIAELDDDARHLERNHNLIDLQGIGDSMLERLLNAHHKKEVVGNMLKTLIVENIATGVLVIPPPLLSTSFQELGKAAAMFSEVKAYKEIPFPFPFIAVTSFLLLFYGLLTPFFMAQWAASGAILSAAMYTYIAVVTLLMLHGVARELDNPFGTDVNDIDMQGMQENLNQRLVVLLEEAEAARQPDGVRRPNPDRLSERYRSRRLSATVSFAQVSQSQSMRMFRQHEGRPSEGSSDGR